MVQRVGGEEVEAAEDEIHARKLQDDESEKPSRRSGVGPNHACRRCHNRNRGSAWSGASGQACRTSKAPPAAPDRCGLKLFDHIVCLRHHRPRLPYTVPHLWGVPPAAGIQYYGDAQRCPQLAAAVWDRDSAGCGRWAWPSRRVRSVRFPTRRVSGRRPRRAGADPTVRQVAEGACLTDPAR